MKYLVFDVETTTKNKGNPFTKSNRLCFAGFKFLGEKAEIFDCTVESHRESIQKLVDSADCLVGFNAKFDLHWLSNIGVDCSKCRIWDCQLAEFILDRQRNRYPSLNGSAAKYNLGQKVDVVAELWAKGVDTLDIPKETVVQYLYGDLELTEKLFNVQRELFSGPNKSMWRLFLLHCEDLHVLKDMESNGIKYDVERSKLEATKCQNAIDGIEKELLVGYDDIPINWDSNVHLSAYLYGGTIAVESRVPVGTFKTGAKVGQTRFKKVIHEFKLPQMVAPIKGSELQAEGVYSTDEKTLRQLRGNKEVKERIRLLNKRSEYEKLRGTYHEGIPKKILEMDWPDGYFHSSLNQCVVVTGRLSSTNPNQQNMPPETKQLCVSRYDC